MSPLTAGIATAAVVLVLVVTLLGVLVALVLFAAWWDDRHPDEREFNADYDMAGGHIPDPA